MQDMSGFGIFMFGRRILSIKKLDNYKAKEFTKLVTPLFSMIGANIHQTKKFGKIRDALLPRLMNGEIDVSGVEI